MKINTRTILLSLFFIVLILVTSLRWETVTEIGEGPYLVKRDRITSIEREYLPGRHGYENEQDRYLVNGVTFILYALMGVTSYALYRGKESPIRQEQEERIDYITKTRWFGWVKILALALIVVLVIVAYLLFQVILKLL